MVVRILDVSWTTGESSPWILVTMARHPIAEDDFPDLLARAADGDREAVSELFVDLQPRLLRFLRSTDRALADDVAGDTWYSIARGIGSFHGDLAGFRAWAFTIARRRLVDHRRLAARRPMTTGPIDELEVGDPGSDSADAAVARMTGQEAADAIAGVLSPDQTEVVLLRILGDLDVAQVAEVMDRTANWVRVTQHREIGRAHV